MKSFDEFWKSIPEERFTSIAEKVEDHISKEQNNEETDNLSFSQQIVIASILINKEILNLYHNWISE